MDTYEVESMTLPTSVLKSCVTDVFIETGSYDGRTIEQALQVGFKEVHSIELSPTYYQICEKRFANDPRVHLYFGDSELLLPRVLFNLKSQATFWLDAHVQEGVLGMHAAPLLYELTKIRGHFIKNHVIMIDDIRLMGQGWWQDLNLEAVKDIILTINGTYTFEQADSKAAAADILIARVL